MSDINGIRIINDVMCCNAESFIERGENLLNRIDAFLGLDPVAESLARADRLDDTIMLDVLDGVQKRGALPVLRATAARGRLIRAGVLVQKTKRAKWRIDPAKDPRTKV